MVSIDLHGIFFGGFDSSKYDFIIVVPNILKFLYFGWFTVGLTRLLQCIPFIDASNNRMAELNTSLFTPDGLTVEGIHLLDDMEEDSVTTKRRYNFRDRVRIEYSAFFDDEIRELKRKKGLRVKLSSDELKPMIGGLYPCSECGKTYKQKSSLAKHQKLHTGMSHFICMKCDKCFTHRCFLRRHERIHAVKKPFACPDCEKCFSDFSALQKHQRLHSGYKPYKCSECDKTFSISNYLILHQRTHTGEKPYICDKCGKSFTQSSQSEGKRLMPSCGLCALVVIMYVFNLLVVPLSNSTSTIG
ncbi:uncharacterized protein [Phyllobates terribilis]|uniref:uncharacterized protein n=1 Tax=Phyllobates terribilis TaxID=111132 RepID=UPI003CCB43FE